MHTELRLPKRRRGQRNSTAREIIAAVRQLVLIASDDLIAGILNRNGLLSGHGNRWTRERVTAHSGPSAIGSFVQTLTRLMPVPEVSCPRNISNDVIHNPREQFRRGNARVNQPGYWVSRAWVADPGPLLRSTAARRR